MDRRLLSSFYKISLIILDIYFFLVKTLELSSNLKKQANINSFDYNVLND